MEFRTCHVFILFKVCKQLDVLSNLGPEYGSSIKLDVLSEYYYSLLIPDHMLI